MTVQETIMILQQLDLEQTIKRLIAQPLENKKYGK
jgi:hypothetical protein